MWKAGLFGHFVDFKKAFDSVHREGLWNIMRSYGIPDKMVRVIVDIYRIPMFGRIKDQKTNVYKNRAKIPVFRKIR